MNDDLKSINGIGNKRVELLNSMGIFSSADLIRYRPKLYMDFTKIIPVSSALENQDSCFKLTVKTTPKRNYIGKNQCIVSVKASDESGSVTLYWFNQPYAGQGLASGKCIYVYGSIDDKKRISSPTVFTKEPLPIVPVYRVKKGISQTLLRNSISCLLSDPNSACHCDMLKETLPEKLREKYGLLPIFEAYLMLHFPKTTEQCKAACKRLVFEDMLYFRIALAYIRLKRQKLLGIAFDTENVLNLLTEKLPFTLTSGQLSAIEQISVDMQRDTPMNRLIQGDVGSGKTVVAFFAMLSAVKSGYQAIMLAPTEILAFQHYEALIKIVGEVEEGKVCLLTGSVTKKNKEIIYNKIRQGEAMYIIGTHALLQESVEFNRAGLLICDEQQRFGVKQRALIQSTQKNKAALDVLVLSATPIPRTLALTMYGDLDVTQITTLPVGKKPINTKIVYPNKRAAMYQYLFSEAKQGRQAYVVCPQIDETEEQDFSEDTKSVLSVYKELTAIADVPVGLLHGKLSAKEKETQIEAFRNGAVSILVSTTVIEVGVDVKNAYYMVIESANSFGLSQLHQLRGRVGRNDKTCYCFLMADSLRSASERLKILTSTNDGFEIAKKDLELRGPGQFFSSEQHGLSEMGLLSLASDASEIESAKNAAEDILKFANDESAQKLISEAINRFYSGICLNSLN